MLTAIFQDRYGYLAACLLAALCLGGAAWLVARRMGRPYGVWWSALVATVAMVLGVTFMGGGPASSQCVVNHDLAEPFRTTQGLWNLGMTVPLGLFALLALRRPLPALAGVVVLPLAIEFTQAKVSGLGRVCDSADAQMNILGGLAGFAVAAWVLTRRGALDWRSGAKATLIASGVLLVLGAGVARPAVTLTHVDGTGLSEADSSQRRAVERAVREAFGDRYELGRVQNQPCLDAACQNVIFTLLSRDKEHPGAFSNGTLSWPDKRHLNVLLKDSDRPSVMGYPVTGAKAPSTGPEAYRIAEAYMCERYPWARTADEHKTYPVGGKAELGWMTSWRWIDNEVLMPRMFDVQVDRTGTVSQVDVTRGPARLELPEAKLNAAQAEEAARKAMTTRLQGTRAAPADLRVEAFTLKAVERQGTWRPEWLVNLKAGSAHMEPWRVDAVTGQVHNGLNTPVKK